MLTSQKNGIFTLFSKLFYQMDILGCPKSKNFKKVSQKYKERTDIIL
jgi:hypothetical protein